MYVVTGATGNTGKSVAQGLLDAGKKVRVISRSAEKVKHFTDKGAEAFIGNMENPDFMNRCLEGAKAVYAMIPLNIAAPNMREYQNTISDALTSAIRFNGVAYVISLSSIGANLTDSTGIVLGLHDLEQKLNAIEGINVLHLRAAHFLENLYAQIALIKQMGIMGSTVKANIAIPMVATKDISAVAVKRLLALDFKGTGNVAYVLGAKDYTFEEAAHILGNAIGNPDLHYKELAEEQQKQGMVQSGTSESMAEALIRLNESTNEGILMNGVKRSAENTTPTSLEAFSQQFKQAYENSGQ